MKYPNGFLDKIDYWTLQLSTGRNTLDFALIKKASEKLVYFSNRHMQLIASGQMVPGQTGEMVDPDMDPAGGYGLRSHE
jgi:hypothetical protein